MKTLLRSCLLTLMLLGGFAAISEMTSQPRPCTPCGSPVPTLPGIPVPGSNS
jgi:hypothetical protein